MSRGGRRRRGRRSGQGGQAPVAAAPANATQASPSRRRRRGGRGRARPETSAIDSMYTRPQTLQTLPADGVVLEELIETMQDEYGTPSTPQEYRLIIKTPVSSSEETAEPVESERPRPETDEPRVRRRGRRRGRTRVRIEGDDHVASDEEPQPPSAVD